MNEILIVPAITAEAELLQQIARETFQESYAAVNTPENMKQYMQENFSIARLSAQLSDQDCEFYFAMQKNQPLGYMKINYRGAQTEMYNSRAIELERIYVLQSHQGKKIGQQLFNHAVTLAMEARAPFLWLGVWEHNAKAIGFYRKNGFEEFATHAFQLGSEKQTDLVMRLNLPLHKLQ
ncbi:GNAT family N-acetyltransferase [Chitinophaga polysaccharea]|uniref:GNAT family N-acetyltransferase n=1 Tax=Chitinophaga polysaccharea TaxID=1293035 RepID=UPI00115A620F|nr:GNAT family N-acetyltransferase [Chitinophaga polysaccharea]